MDINALSSRVQAVLKDPKGIWSTIAQEAPDPKQLLLNYTLPLIVAAQIANFIKLAVFGIHVPFIGTVRVPITNALMQAVTSVVVGVGLLFIASFIWNALAPKFGGSTTQPRCFQLIAYGATASLVGQVLVIVPVIGYFLGLGFGIYGIYTLYQGVTPMTGVPAEKRPIYVLAALVCSAIVGAILMWLVVPHYSPDSLSLTTSSGKEFDTRDLDAAAKSAQDFLKSLPQAQGR